MWLILLLIWSSWQGQFHYHGLLNDSIGIALFLIWSVKAMGMRRTFSFVSALVLGVSAMLALAATALVADTNDWMGFIYAWAFLMTFLATFFVVERIMTKVPLLFVWRV